MRAGRAVLFFIVIVFLLAAGACASTWRPGMDAIDPPPRSRFDPQLVEKGASLAALGDCDACHTAPGGRIYAGGRALHTPFGTLYGTNITPDPYTGIGSWSQEAFVRAMREGVDREGRHLYPAFPYDHFTLLSDDDLAALYAFVMTRDPVRVQTPSNRLNFPFNLRPLIAAWKLLYFDRAGFTSDPGRSAQWNRGAYLARGIAHCGACHTPRNRFGAEKRDAFLAGGDIEGWHAPALDASSPAPAPWTADRLYTYLRNGSEATHGAAAGPMKPVVRNLSGVAESEVRAIAAYVASLAPQTKDRGAPLAATRRPPPPAGDDAAALLYRGACAQCHDAPRTAATSAGALDLSLSTAVSAPTPRNFLNVVLQGIVPGEGERGRWMPSFAGILTDAQLVALANHVRGFAPGAAPWEKVGEEVTQARRTAAR